MDCGGIGVGGRVVQEPDRWAVGLPPDDGGGAEGWAVLAEVELHGDDAALVVGAHEEGEGGVEDEPGGEEDAAGGFVFGEVDG